MVLVFVGQGPFVLVFALLDERAGRIWTTAAKIVHRFLQLNKVDLWPMWSADAGAVAFPNPASGRLFVQNWFDTHVQVSGTDGRLVLAGALDRAGLDVSALPNGVYTLRRYGRVDAIRFAVVH